MDSNYFLKEWFKRNGGRKGGGCISKMMESNVIIDDLSNKHVGGYTRGAWLVASVARLIPVTNRAIIPRHSCRNYSGREAFLAYTRLHEIK